MADIQAHLAEIAQHDDAIDDQVFTLYGITDAADRRRVVSSAPVVEEE